MTTNKMREEFEAWALSRDLPIAWDRQRPSYTHGGTQVAWLSWQAATRRALPEGMALVPVEPTPEMLAAAAPFPEHLRLRHPDDKTWEARMQAATAGDQMVAAQTYRKMLAAAPAAPAARESGAQDFEGYMASEDWSDEPTPYEVAERAFAAGRASAKNDAAESVQPVAQGGGVDVEKVMALVEEYAALVRRELAATIGSVRRFREGEADEKRAEIRALLASNAVPVGDGWIAVGDRLPEENNPLQYLVADSSGYVFIATYEFYDTRHAFTTYDGWRGTDDHTDAIIAWQPLPPAAAPAATKKEEGHE